MAQTTAPGPVRERPVPGEGRRRLTFWIGAALLLAGVVLLGSMAWQFFGTNAVAHHAQEQIVDSTRRAWSQADDAGSGSSGTVEPGARPALPAGAAPALVRIPRFGSDYEMPLQWGTDDEVLAEGFGHFRGTAFPGHVGNLALAAHRVTHGEPLRDMPSLRPGDEVIVETRTRVLTYRLDTDPNDLVVGFRDVWVVDPLPRNPSGGVRPDQEPGQRLITLTTCSELFHTDDRMIAFGHLVDSTPREPGT